MSESPVNAENVKHADTSIPNYANSQKTNVPIFSLQAKFCTLVWCFACFYSIFRAVRSSQELYSKLSFDDFESGWEKLGSRPRDISDYEWAVFSQIMLTYAPWVVLHLIVTNIIKSYHPKFLLHFFVISSVIFLLSVVGLCPTLLLLFQIFLMFVMHLPKKKLLCWLGSGIFILFLNFETGTFIKDLMDLSDSREEYILSVTISWTTCRCLSFCLLQCDSEENSFGENKILQMLAYILYLPLLLTGPLVPFDDFRRDIESQVSFRSYLSSLFGFFRYSFWFVFNILIRHYVYLSALNYHPHLLENLPTWTLCGFALGMSLIFMLKYVVLFGLPSTLAEAEGFKAPSKPKCIARIHLYSDMWKHFDRGLYTFLKRFVYLPVVDAGRNKLLGGFFCFTFIYFWHGTTKSIFVWTLLNFIGVTLENVAANVQCTRYYRNITAKMSEFMRHQLHTGFTAILLIMSALSNFYFICGYEVGNIFLKRFILAGLSGPIIPIWMVLVCMCHSCEAIKRWEFQRERRYSTFESFSKQ